MLVVQWSRFSASNTRKWVQSGPGAYIPHAVWQKKKKKKEKKILTILCHKKLPTREKEM